MHNNSKFKTETLVCSLTLPVGRLKCVSCKAKNSVEKDMNGQSVKSLKQLTSSNGKTDGVKLIGQEASSSVVRGCCISVCFWFKAKRSNSQELLWLLLLVDWGLNVLQESLNYKTLKTFEHVNLHCHIEGL